MNEIEPINNSLKKINIPSFQERYEMMRRTTIEHPKVQQFLQENEKLVHKDMVERSLPRLNEYISQSHECCGASNSENCTNYLKGFVPKLFIANNAIDITYQKCSQKLLEEERRNVESSISSMYMPKDVMKARLEQIDADTPSRALIKKASKNFVDYYRDKGQLPSKGFYLHGSFGIGKSFILGAIANELAMMRVQSVLVFVPEFLREMKNSISDNSLQEKVDFVKKAQVLMLDDLGAETMSAWVRDEILGTILHYRMSEQLPTFITSNFNYDELENHLAQSARGDIEEVKARRIMERVKAITTLIEMDGSNRRK